MTSFTSKTLLSPFRKDKLRDGFTLTEVMSVVAITSILTAASLPALTKETNKAKDSATITTLTIAAKECSLSLINHGNHSTYLDATTNKPFDGRFSNVGGSCEEGGVLTLISPGRAIDTTNETHIAKVIFDGDVPRSVEFNTEAN